MAQGVALDQDSMANGLQEPPGTRGRFRVGAGVPLDEAFLGLLEEHVGSNPRFRHLFAIGEGDPPMIVTAAKPPAKDDGSNWDTLLVVVVQHGSRDWECCIWVDCPKQGPYFGVVPNLGRVGKFRCKLPFSVSSELVIEPLTKQPYPADRNSPTGELRAVDLII